MINPISAIHFDSKGRLYINFNVVDKMDEEERLVVATCMNIYEGLGAYDESISKAISIRKNYFMREAIESLLFCEDISDNEICELLSIDIDVIDVYVLLFCYVDMLGSFFEKRAFIESEIYRMHNQSSGTKEEAAYIKTLLFKRWSLALGKEFVIWKFGLKPVSINTAELANEIEKEAFFYYKEISLSELDVDHDKYFRIISSMVKAMREVAAVRNKEAAGDLIIDDIRKAIGFDIEEEMPACTVSNENIIINSTIS